MSTRSSDPLAFRAVHWQVGEGTPFGVLYPFCIANLWGRTSFFFSLSFTLMQQSIRPTTTFLTSDRGSDEESLRISRPEPLADSLIFKLGGLGGGPSAFPFDPPPFTDPLPHY